MVNKYKYKTKPRIHKDENPILPLKQHLNRLSPTDEMPSIPARVGVFFHF